MEELQVRKEGKVDVIVPAKTLTMGQDGMVRVPNPNGETAYTFNPTDWAHGQVAAKLQIPKPYYDRMKKDAPGLMAMNVNTWFDKSDGLNLIRSWNGEMTAFLSNKYRAIDNYDVADVVIRTVYGLRQNVHMNENSNVVRHEWVKAGQGDNIVLNKAYVTDRVMNFQIVDPTVVYQPFPDKPEDTYSPGMNVRNSEVGYASFVIEPFLFRQLCDNGAVLGFEGFERRHIGERKDEGHLWSNRTNDIEKNLILSKVNDATTKVFSPDFYTDVMERFGQLNTEKLPPKIIDASVKLLGIREDDKDEIYKRIDGNTRYDYIQAITNRANDYTKPGAVNPERAYELQVIGGNLMTSRELWKKIDREAERLTS